MTLSGAGQVIVVIYNAAGYGNIREMMSPAGSASLNYYVFGVTT